MDVAEDTIREEIHADFDYVQNRLSDKKLFTKSGNKYDAIRSNVFLLFQSCSFAVTEIFEKLLLNLDKINELVHAMSERKDCRNQLLYDCLEIAKEKKHEDVVRILVEFAASKPEYFKLRVTEEQHLLILEGLTFLQEAASKGDVELITMLISAGVNVNQTNEMGETALHFAKNASTAALLITNGADVNVMNINNETPLYYAATSCRLGVIRTLLDNGAIPNLGSSFIPLHVACEWDNDRSIAGAIQQTYQADDTGAAIRMPASCAWFYKKRRWNDDSRAPYCKSCKYENHLLADAIKAIEIENDKNAHESSTLLSAIRNYHHSKVTGNNLMNLNEIKQLLSENDSAIVNAIDSDGTTALYYAMQRNLIEVATLLLDSGADPNLSTSGKYPLFLACRFLSHEVVELLLTRGADPNVMGNYNHTPLQIAVKSLDFRVVKLLVEHGADVNHRDKYRNTAFDLLVDEPDRWQCLSSISARIRIAKYLLDNGFNINMTITDRNRFFSDVISKASYDCCKGFNYMFMEILFESFWDSPSMQFLWVYSTYSSEIPSSIRRYLRLGGNPNHRNRSYSTLLSSAFAQSNVHCARILLAAGADPNLVTWDSIVEASMHDNVSVLDAMLACGVKFDVPGTIEVESFLCSLEPEELITLDEFYVPFCTETGYITRLFKAGSTLEILASCCKARLKSYPTRLITCLMAGRLCQAVVLAGHKVHQYRLLVQLRESERPEARVLASWLCGESMTPPSLMRLSRTAIRRQLSVASGCRTILPLIDVLPLHEVIQLYLKFEGPLSEIDLSPGRNRCAGCHSNYTDSDY